LGISLHSPYFEEEIRTIFEKEIKNYEIKKAKRIQVIFFACQNETEN